MHAFVSIIIIIIIIVIEIDAASDLQGHRTHQSYSLRPLLEVFNKFPETAM